MRNLKTACFNAGTGKDKAMNSKSRDKDPVHVEKAKHDHRVVVPPAVNFNDILLHLKLLQDTGEFVHLEQMEGLLKATRGELERRP